MFHSKLCDTLVQKLLFKRIPRGWRYQLCIQEPAFAMLNTRKKILAIEKQSLKLPTQYRLKQELIQKPVLAVMCFEPTTNVQSDMKVTIKDEEMEEERIETPVNCNICKQVNCKISTNDVWAHSVGKIRRMYCEECGLHYKSVPQHSYLGRHQEIREKKPRIVGIEKIFGATPNESMDEKSATDVEY